MSDGLDGWLIAAIVARLGTYVCSSMTTDAVRRHGASVGWLTVECAGWQLGAIVLDAAALGASWIARAIAFSISLIAALVVAHHEERSLAPCTLAPRSSP